ncbi:MAG: pyruvate dehydrogenase (acetyl-transferring) E1 component subunit alpha, partial [Kofleriaceae bacterium]
MLLIRRFEERCAIEYQATRIRGFLHLYIGEEAVAVGCLEALEPRDNVLGTYREHGHALARGLALEVVMAEMFGKAAGCSRGRGGSMHLFSAEHRFFGGHAIVGGGLPVAVGLALADQVRGTGAVTAVFFGEGAVVEGEFHEAMNLAALWRLPVVFVCENNLYAMGTAIARAQAQTEPWRRAAGYGISAEAV